MLSMLRMGKAAAAEAGIVMRRMLSEKDEISCIFAAAPSQNEFLASLIEEDGIDWTRVNAYHMDEYVGLGLEDEPAFSHFLTEAIFSKVPFKSINLINGKAESAEAEAERYSGLLNAIDVDITFMGIGENGHIAFNDPDVADFNDKKVVKPVILDEICRNQQVNDGCFKTIDEVPTHAMTLTVPTLVAAPWLFCIVPAATKANAVYETINGSIDEHCPASILRLQEHAVLYLDKASASLL